MNWYCVRCVVAWPKSDLYEERMTLWEASSPESALELAEAEVFEYVRLIDNGAEYVGLAQSYLIGSELPRNGDEMFSLIRKSELPPDRYIDQFFDTGCERQQNIDS